MLVIVITDDLCRLPTRLALDLEFFLLLAANQSAITRIYLARLGLTLPTALSTTALNTNFFKSLKLLTIPGDVRSSDTDELASCGRLIEQSKNLTGLQITVGDIDGVDDDDDILDDKENSDGLLIKSLFGHVAPYGTSAPLLLEVLLLSQVELNYAPRTFMRVIKFTNLHTLVLQSCSGSHALLKALKLLFETDGTSLHSFDYQGAAIQPEIMEGFLSSFTGLRSLKCYYCDDDQIDLPRLSCIKGHCSTLKRLGLDNFNEDRHGRLIYKPLAVEDAEMLGQDFLELREVAVVSPPLGFVHERLLEWGDAGAFFDALSRMPRLRLLRITNWPTVFKGFFSYHDVEKSVRKAIKELNRRRYADVMGEIATAILRRIAESSDKHLPSQLPLICLGRASRFDRVCDEHSRFSMKATTQYYIPSSHADAFGGSRLVATPIEETHAKYSGLIEGPYATKIA